MPPELLGSYSTIEYIITNKPPPTPPVFLYVVDTCVEEDDLKALKDAIIVSLSLLPKNALVGLITYGTMAMVHEITFNECPKAYVFRGNKEYQTKQIGEMLGLGSLGRLSQSNIKAPNMQMNQQQTSGANRYNNT